MILLPVSLLGASQTKHCDAANKLITFANSCGAAPVVVEQPLIPVLIKNINLVSNIFLSCNFYDLFLSLRIEVKGKKLQKVAK